MKMKLKMKSLGVKVKPMSDMTVSKKPIEKFPEVELHSGMPAMKDCGLENMKAGTKGSMMVNYEVKGDRSPDEWELREGSMKPTDRHVTMKLTGAKLATEQKKEHGYKNINEASIGARKEMSS